MAVMIRGVTFLLVLCSCSTALDPIDGSRSLPGDLRGHDWELVTFRTARGKVLSLQPSEVYRLTFESDSTFNGRADCNTVSGKYEIAQPGMITMGPIGTTYALCREESHYHVYLTALFEADVYDTEDGRLRIGFGKRGELAFRQADGGLSSE